MKSIWFQENRHFRFSGEFVKHAVGLNQFGADDDLCRRHSGSLDQDTILSRQRRVPRPR